jgi:prepilin-type N-terminal cleavage/methylation domain-containing protein
MDFKMRKWIFRKSNQYGFSLLEVIIAMGLLAGVSVVAMKIMETLESNKKSAEGLAAQKQAHLMQYKQFDKAMTGLDEVNFDLNLVYYRKPNNKLARSILDVSQSDINGYTPTPKLNTSFRYYVKSFDSDVEIFYASVCVPFDDYREIPPIEDILTPGLVPYVNYTNSGKLLIRCCPRRSPDCTDEGRDLLEVNTDYVARIVKVSKKISTGDYSFKMWPKVSDMRFISGMGFYIGFPNNQKKQLDATVYSYGSECLNNALAKVTGKKCKGAFRIDKNRSFKSFNQEVGIGINELSNDLNL